MDANNLLQWLLNPAARGNRGQDRQGSMTTKAPPAPPNVPTPTLRAAGGGNYPNPSSYGVTDANRMPATRSYGNLAPAFSEESLGEILARNLGTTQGDPTGLRAERDNYLGPVEDIASNAASELWLAENFPPMAGQGAAITQASALQRPQPGPAAAQASAPVPIPQGPPSGSVAGGMVPPLNQLQPQKHVEFQALGPKPGQPQIPPALIEAFAGGSPMAAAPPIAPAPAGGPQIPPELLAQMRPNVSPPAASTNIDQLLRGLAGLPTQQPPAPSPVPAGRPPGPGPYPFEGGPLIPQQLSAPAPVPQGPVPGISQPGSIASPSLPTPRPIQPVQPMAPTTGSGGPDSSTLLNQAELQRFLAANPPPQPSAQAPSPPRAAPVPAPLPPVAGAPAPQPAPAPALGNQIPDILRDQLLSEAIRITQQKRLGAANGRK